MSRPRNRARWPAVALLAGFAFLYAPIVSIVLYSFSASHGGPLWPVSLRWYAALAEDDAMKTAAMRSLELALLSAIVAAVLLSLEPAPARP